MSVLWMSVSEALSLIYCCLQSSTTEVAVTEARSEDLICVRETAPIANAELSCAVLTFKLGLIRILSQRLAVTFAVLFLQ